MADSSISTTIQLADERLAPGMGTTLTVGIWLPAERPWVRLFLTVPQDLLIHRVKSYPGKPLPQEKKLDPPGYSDFREKNKFTGHTVADPSWDWGESVLLADIPATGIFADDDGKRPLLLSWAIGILANGEHYPVNSKKTIQLYVRGNDPDEEIIPPNAGHFVVLSPPPNFWLVRPMLITHTGHIWLDGIFVEPPRNQDLDFQYSVGEEHYSQIVERTVRHEAERTTFSVRLPDEIFKTGADDEVKTYVGVKLRVRYVKDGECAPFSGLTDIAVTINNHRPALENPWLSVTEDHGAYSLVISGAIRVVVGAADSRSAPQVAISWNGETTEDSIAWSPTKRRENQWTFTLSSKTNAVKGSLKPQLLMKSAAGVVEAEPVRFISANGLVDMSVVVNDGDTMSFAPSTSVQRLTCTSNVTPGLVLITLKLKPRVGIQRMNFKVVMSKGLSRQPAKPIHVSPSDIAEANERFNDRWDGTVGNSQILALPEVEAQKEIMVVFPLRTEAGVRDELILTAILSDADAAFQMPTYYEIRMRQISGH
ncbi:hypothetical protein E9536_40920 [Burkholderia sp. LS-044]|uniref:hypothetical protein n=1 Tax=Burkholderia sp. LS-044 TaxID=1459967 RepID=UPI0010A6787E|nr:hypothetical protein [Burkholderia sp. LS-044]THJ45643.1 hypothetical protein E9536_40920 [Burkholderia sp. LS-044]